MRLSARPWLRNANTQASALTGVTALAGATMMFELLCVLAGARGR